MKVKIKRLLLKLLQYVLRCLPIDRRKVLFVNYFGRGFGDNGKAIALALQSLKPELDLVWACTEAEAATLPEGIRWVPYRSVAYYRELVTAAVWVDNCRKGSEICKRKGQYYIQAWHGPISFKKIEKDVEKSLSPAYVKDAKHDSALADLILSGSTFFTELCRRTFWYDGEILACGTPRLDEIFHPTADPAKVKKALNIPQDKKIVLYAPTFRADYNTACYQMDFEAVLDRLQAITGQEWVFAVRLHPNAASKADFIHYNDRVINATPYPDLYELLPLVDLLISDYSSCSFEAGMIGKPVAIFALDVESYRQDRDLYFDFEKLPFPFCQSNGELLEKLPQVWQPAYEEALTAFNQSLGLCENGMASEAVAKRILEVIENGK